MRGRPHFGAFRALLIVGVFVLLAPAGARAVPYADMVMDARSGEVLHSTNADSRLHPASLTKMMTLYIAFEAIRMGEITLDTQVTISAKAAAEPPSKLGLRAGQRIQLRYLIRAAAVKSANDAATAIGEAIEGSEAAFARRMNRTAQALGMTRSTFRNAHGLTEDGHLSTARDMTVLGRHLFYDYPQYYNIFSRRTTNAGGTEVANTNRRFLDAYEGADGIKTGYTRAAGFNLVASAERRRERIIATVFGGTSTAQRNARMAELLDLGFARAPSRAPINPPGLPRYDTAPAGGELLLAEGAPPPETAAGRIVRVSGAVPRSPRPLARAGGAPAEELLAAIETDVAAALVAVAVAEEAAAPVSATSAAAAPADDALAAVALAAAGALEEVLEQSGDAVTKIAEVEIAAAALADDPVPSAVALAVAPPPRPVEMAAAPDTAGAETEPDSLDASLPAIALAEAAERGVAGAGAGLAVSLVAELPSVPVPDPGPPPVALAEMAPLAAPASGAPGAAPTAAPTSHETGAVTLALAAPLLAPSPDPVLRPEPEAAELVTRLSTSGGRYSGVTIGRYASRYEAEKALIATALSDTASFGAALRRVVQRGGAFEANFMGMSSEAAALACRRIAARGNACETIGG